MYDELNGLKPCVKLSVECAGVEGDGKEIAPHGCGAILTAP